MDKQTAAIVQATWQQVAAIALQAAALFYQNLFEADPTLKPLFKGNMEEQGDKLMQMKGLAVSKLDSLETLVPILQNLAERHSGYGMKEAHFDTVGTALLKTLQQGPGEAFTPNVKAAWAEVYGAMAGVMISATVVSV
jgi:hemoglobin-like flavoprotein